MLQSIYKVKYIWLFRVHINILHERDLPKMRIGEVCLLTNDVVKLADFYKALLGIDNDSNDTVHQTLLAEETMLTVYSDNSVKNNNNQNICLAFTVENVDAEYERLLKLGAEIIEKPTTRPWGARNMSFYDPDRNKVYLRSFWANKLTFIRKVRADKEANE